MSVMASALYNTEILRLATRIPFATRLDAPMVTVTRTSRICGSRITLDADFEAGRMKRLGLEVRACALGQASTALLAPLLPEIDRWQLQSLRSGFEAMLKEDAAAPDALPALEIFLPVRAHRSRFGSVLLIYDAAIAAYEAQDALMAAP